MSAPMRRPSALARLDDNDDENRRSHAPTPGTFPLAWVSSSIRVHVYGVLPTPRIRHWRAITTWPGASR